VKPTAPSDDDAPGAIWPAVLPHRAEVLRWRPNSCKAGSHPGTHFHHAGHLKKKRITVTHQLTTAAQVRCDFQSIARQLQTWSLLLGDRPQHAQGTTWHYPSRCHLPRNVLLHVGPQRCPCAAAAWRYGEPSALLAGGKPNPAGSAGEILCV